MHQDEQRWQASFVAPPVGANAAQECVRCNGAGSGAVVKALCCGGVFDGVRAAWW